MNTAFVLFINELGGEKVFSPYDKSKGNPIFFVDALYFQVVTMMTIGYGDVAPIYASGRLITTFFILLCAVLFNKWFSDLFNIISQ